jgi:ferredoxin
VKASIDDDSCRGHGICCTLCPEVFMLTDDGYSVVKTPAVPPDFEEAVRRAVQSCPERAISVT